MPKETSETAPKFLSAFVLGDCDLDAPASGLLVDLDFGLRHLPLKTLCECAASGFGSPQVTLGRGEQFAIILAKGLEKGLFDHKKEPVCKTTGR